MFDWMKENKGIAITIAVVVVLAIGWWTGVGRARAADMGGPQYVSDRTETKTRWAGCYIGAGAGYASTVTEIGAGGLGIDGIGSNGAKATLALGCDMKLTGSPVVLGVFADWTPEGLNSNEFSVSPGLFSARFGQQYSIGGRIGYSLPGAMPYLLLAYAHTDVSYSVPLPLPSSFSGVAYGGGIEFPIAKNLSAGIEGRYTHYQSETITGTPISLQPTELSVMGSLKLRFDLP